MKDAISTTPPVATSASRWLETLCRSYTTAEQLDNHRGVSSGEGRAVAEITFF